MEVEVKKLEDAIKAHFLDKETKVIRQGGYDHTDKFKDYHYKLISLMPWLGPHITKQIDQGSALQMVKCVKSIVTIKGGYFPGNMMYDRMKLYTGDVTT